MTFYIVSRFLEPEYKPREIIDQAENKATAEEYARNYRQAFGTSFAVTVLSNPPEELLRDWEDA